VSSAAFDKLLTDDLDGDRLLQIRVEGPINHAHPALADPRLNLVLS